MRKKIPISQGEIVVFTGSRSEFGLLEPIIKEIEPTVLVSGSHLSSRFGFTYKQIEEKYQTYPVEILMDSDSVMGTCKSMGLGLISLSDALVELNPSIVVILGDRYESLACALSAFNLDIPIAHIEGSDVTLGSKDNGYRKCIDALATLRFPVEEYGSLGCVFPELPPPLYPVSALVVYHPYQGDYQKEFCALMGLMERHVDAFFISPNADAGGRWIMDGIENSVLNSFKNLKRVEYLALLKQAEFIIGNSSSGIIEAPSLGTPTVNIGDRQKGRIRASSVIDCEGAAEEIKEAINKVKSITFPVDNPYAKPDTVRRIAEEIKKF